MYYGFFGLMGFLFVSSRIFGDMAGLIWLIGWIVYYYFYGKLSFKYLSWLFEKRGAGEHRKEWLEFKNFIYKNSALQNKPLKYYEIWDEFYYYALAVGAIKNYK